MVVPTLTNAVSIGTVILLGKYTFATTGQTISNKLASCMHQTGKEMLKSLKEIVLTFVLNSNGRTWKS
jgi:phosphopentomutase